ncbi:MAG: hypothetical protein IT233_06415 [Bacteroidia bacterium]|nr:hypothetical protein [Bacteroidia bacterium]
MYNLLRKTLFTVMVLLVFVSCREDEVYPVEPVIEFLEYSVYPGDSGLFRVNFTDGDGDVGYEAGDSVKDFFLDYRYLDTASGLWKPFYQLVTCTHTPAVHPFDTAWMKFEYTIPRVVEEDDPKGVKGEILIHGPSAPHFVPGHTYKYLCWIFDRAGHKSNQVESQIVYP